MADKPKPKPKPFPGAAPPFKPGPKKPKKRADLMGGKPSTATPADRRLAENKPRPSKPVKVPKPSKP